MKIVYLANARIPTEKAHGIQIMKMGEAFKKQNLDVELVVARRKDNQLEKEDPFTYYNLGVKFSIRKLPLIDLVDRSRSLRGLSVLIQNTSFAISAFFYLLFKKVDIIYSRDEFSLFFLSLFKNNLVLEIHNFPTKKKGLYKFVLQRVKKIIVITQQLKRLVIEMGISEEKVIVCPDGVDLDSFDIEETQKECQQKLNLPLDKNIILYTGHLFVWKGVYTLVESSRFLSDKEFIVVIGGMDYDRGKVENLIREKGLKNILITGHRPPAEIPFYLRAADILVLPNSGRKEISRFFTSPMKLFEYMAARKPIIASDLPSIREILNSANAVLFEPDNPKSLAEGIKKILDDGEFVESLINNSYEKVKKYTWDKRVVTILDFIK